MQRFTMRTRPTIPDLVAFVKQVRTKYLLSGTSTNVSIFGTNWGLSRPGLKVIIKIGNTNDITYVRCFEHKSNTFDCLRRRQDEETSI